MGSRRVRANPQDHYIVVLIAAVIVPEIAGLGGAAGGVIFGIKNKTEWVVSGIIL